MVWKEILGLLAGVSMLGSGCATTKSYNIETECVREIIPTSIEGYTSNQILFYKDGELAGKKTRLCGDTDIEYYLFDDQGKEIPIINSNSPIWKKGGKKVKVSLDQCEQLLEDKYDCNF